MKAPIKINDDGRKMVTSLNTGHVVRDIKTSPKGENGHESNTFLLIFIL